MLDEILRLVGELRGLLKTPRYMLEPDFEALAASEPYRKLIKIGYPALDQLGDCLRGGDIFLNRAIMEIANLRFDDLGLGAFPSEQDVAKCLTDLLSARIFWTAGSADCQTAIVHVALVNQAMLQPAASPVERPVAREFGGDRPVVRSQVKPLDLPKLSTQQLSA